MTLVKLVRRRGQQLAGKVSEQIETRRTPELVIALVGPVGSGCSSAAEKLTELLRTEYNYEVRNHKPSKLIESRCKELSIPVPDLTGGAGERIKALQNLGNELRRRFGLDHLAKLVVREIARYRAEHGYEDEELDVPRPRRVAHIIDGLKHPAEYLLLELVYGDIFWLIGVFAPEITRRERLRNAGVGEDCDFVIAHDAGEDASEGQKVGELFHRSDYFIRNDGPSKDFLKARLDRFVAVMMNVGVNSPTIHEAGMFNAASAATRSACLSRQVGASLYSEGGELLGVGWNEVPRAGGGLYAAPETPGAAEYRCFGWDGPKGRRCYNDFEKDDLADRTLKVLAPHLRDETSHEEFKKTLRTEVFGGLVEFSRSVHAEMEALLSVARSGRGSVVRGSMYTTTFPCHNCARHIVASGVSHVYFIEPYPKSKAISLHGDAIGWETTADTKKVLFLQYEGFAPRNMVEVFGHGSERKAHGLPVTCTRAEAVPVFMPLLDAYSLYEKKILEDLAGDRAPGGAA